MIKFHKNVRNALFFIIVIALVVPAGCYPSKKRKRVVNCYYFIKEVNKEGYKNKKERENLLEAVNKKRAKQRNSN